MPRVALKKLIVKYITSSETIMLASIDVYINISEK
jgi:hypothetical protein